MMCDYNIKFEKRLIDSGVIILGSVKEITKNNEFIYCRISVLIVKIFLNLSVSDRSSLINETEAILFFLAHRHEDLIICGEIQLSLKWS